MSLEVCRLPWVEARSPVTVADQGLLCLSAGSRDGFCLSILIDTGFPDDGAYWVTVTKGIFQPFQNYRCGPFAPPVPIRTAVEGVGFAVFGNQPAPCQHAFGSK